MIESFDADAGVYLEFVDGGEAGPQAVVPTLMIDAGMTEEHRVALRGYAATGGADDPIIVPLIRALSAGDGCVARRPQDLLPDDQWRGNEFREQYMKRFGLDLGMASLLQLKSPEWMVGIGLHRRVGRRGYSPEQRDTFEMFLRYCDWLFHERSPDTSELGRGLAPRLRRVLHRLLNGESAGEIALHFNLSHHTVRGYIKEVYRQLGVSSHAELMALRFAQRGDPEKQGD